MEEQRTPKKRRVGAKKGPPTPNPPLVPFPTPPPSRQRHVRLPTPTFELPSSPTTSHSKMPHHLETLLKLQHAINVALSLHIATRPPVLPPHSSSTTKIPLPNLTTYPAIRETVERSAGRRFGLPELARLAWIWTWDGITITRPSRNENENPFLADSPKREKEISGMSYLVTPTRTLDSSTGRRVHTYGLGIELDLKKGETRQVLHGGNEGGLGNKGQGGGTGAIARWNAGGEAREEMVKERLTRWVELHGGFEPDEPDTGLPTPSSTSGKRSSIPPIPLLELPKLPSSAAAPATNLFSSSPASSGPGLSTPPRHATSSPGGLADPFELDSPATNRKVLRTGSLDERRQAMQDRLKARREPLPTLGSAVGAGRSLPLSGAEQQETLKKRSTLSRLEGVAEAVWMLFSSPSPGPNSLPTPPRGRRKAIPMLEAADVIVKSSKTPISAAEAQTSLTMLADLCPFFLKVKFIGKQEWLEMPLILATPSSPIPTSPSTFTRIEYPTSPLARGKMASPGISIDPVSPTKRADLAGPASPGKVRRAGGLREVRERIRRELGE